MLETCWTKRLVKCNIRADSTKRRIHFDLFVKFDGFLHNFRIVLCVSIAYAISIFQRIVQVNRPFTVMVR